MPRHNYQTRLANLKARHTDTLLNKAFVAESFNRANLPETVRYVYESMRAIEPSYTQKTFEEAERVQNQIRAGITDRNIEFQYQGSVPLNTHIRLHSDLDILTIHRGFYTLEHPLVPAIPYKGDSVADLRRLREDAYGILKRAYYAATVKNDSAKAISISGGSLQRKFDIIVCNWFETVAFNQSLQKNNFLRGIDIFDKKVDRTLTDYPFTHIVKVEEKNRRTNGENFKRVVRLLKNIKADADQQIGLSSFMITSIMYHMEDHKYLPDSQHSSTLLPSASEHLREIINNSQYRQSLYSPNGKEKLFKDDDEIKVAEIRKLKKELDVTIEDMANEIMPGLRSLNEQYGRIDVKNYFEPLVKANYNYL